MKKVAVAVLAFALFMMAFTVAPVMAKAEKVPVTGLSFITPVGAVSPERAWIPGKSEVGQSRGAIGHGYNAYWINDPLPQQPWIPPVLPNGNPNPAPDKLVPDLLFYTTNEISSMINFVALMSIGHWKSVMVYPIPNIGAEEGRFEGEMMVFGTPELTTIHCVYQGSGIFEGQTLMVSGTKLSGQPGVIEGFLLTR